jgi:hypothetical protein
MLSDEQPAHVGKEKSPLAVKIIVAIKIIAIMIIII